MPFKCLEAEEAADTFDGFANDGGAPAAFSAEAVRVGLELARLVRALRLLLLLPLD